MFAFFEDAAISPVCMFRPEFDREVGLNETGDVVAPDFVGGERLGESPIGIPKVELEVSCFVRRKRLEYDDAVVGLEMVTLTEAIEVGHPFR